MIDKDRDLYRYFLKDTIRKKINFALTDQNQKVPVPPVQKEVQLDAVTIELPRPDTFADSTSPAGTWKKIPAMDLSLAIKRRKSRRAYGHESLNPCPLKNLPIFCGAPRVSGKSLTRATPIGLFLLQDAATPLKPIWQCLMLKA